MLESVHPSKFTIMGRFNTTKIKKMSDNSENLNEIV